MTENDPKNSVPEEQFGKTEDTNNVEQPKDAADPKESTKPIPKKEEPVKDEALDTETEKSSAPDDASKEDSSATEDSKKDEVAEAAIEEAKKDEEEVKKDKEEKTEDPLEKESDNNDDSASDQSKQLDTKEEESKESIPDSPDYVDFSKKSKEELLDLLKVYIATYPVEKIKMQVDAIKSNFYKLHNSEIEDKKNHFLENGGQEQDFKIEESPIEITMKELLNEFKEKRVAFNRSLEEQKDVNLKAKFDIIESIKELINSQESLNKTFHDFRNLQEKWREIGPVPQASVKNLWEEYHYHVEAFYDYIKINKELRDLDFKKNLEAKIKLCEKSEELLMEPSVVEAFRKLQTLHDQWREIGPVPSDKRSELWERFKETTSKINHKHQEYFVNLKESQKKNLQEKTVLCEKAEELAALEIDSAKEWEEKSKALIDLQKVWKTIGFAPKKYNTKIYERFRSACDNFFDKKREYFAQNREEQENNLQLKTELCIQAEGICNSTDWKKTTDELIKLQKKWKSIGPVPIKNSEKIWKRFRSACDTFFNAKSEYYANIDSTYNDNLKAKEELIKEIEDFKGSDNLSANIKQLKDFQRKWSEIGFVPIKQKNAIQDKYRALINSKFDALKLDEDHKSQLKFKSKIESISEKPNANKRLAMERDKCYNRLKQLENDIALWENNIGFFSNSKNAESMIADIEHKIAEAKKRMESLQERLNILDDFDN